MSQVRLTKKQEQELRQQLHQTHDARVYRRTLGVLRYGQGGSATAIARTLEVHRCDIHRWWKAYGASWDPTSLLEGERRGRPRRWTGECADWLEVLMTSSPQAWGESAVDWTVPRLGFWLEQLTGWRFSEFTIRQALHEQDYVWKRPRYVLAPDPETEKKTPNSPANCPLASPQQSAGRR